MGLDMYLSAKRYLYRDADEPISDGINELLGIPSDKSKRFHGASFVAKEISIEAMGWRKANAIHGWFVRRCQGGEDNCKEYYVSREQLVELRDLCKAVLDNPDSTGDTDLEPMQGPFFGTYEKDEWYWDDLKRTVEGITSALSLPENEYEFYYQASW